MRGSVGRAPLIPDIIQGNRCCGEAVIILTEARMGLEKKDPDKDIHGKLREERQEP